MKHHKDDLMRSSLTDDVFTAPTTAAAQPQAAAVRSLLPKASQSGLRPPGFSSSRVATGRLAAFGFVRSSSVSSVTSAHSADSTQSDPCRTSHRESTQYRSVHTRCLPPPPQACLHLFKTVLFIYLITK